MMTRRFWSSLAWASVLVLLLAPRVLADPIVNVTVTPESGGIFVYSYELINDSSESIFDLWLFGTRLPSGDPIGFAGEPMDVEDPPLSGWLHWPVFFDSLTNLGSIEWYSPIENIPSTDLGPGELLSGFSFRSLFGPGTITFEALGWDPVTGSAGTIFAGETIGPVQAVPEPSTLWLMAAGLAVLWRTRHRAQLGSMRRAIDGVL